jgi:uncharacterized membrane protein
MASETTGATTARRATLVALSLLAVLVVAAAIRGRALTEAIALALVLLLPLLAPLPGLLRGVRRTSAWATLCVVPYFVYGLTETIANPAVRYTAGAILFASLALFVALIAHLRLTRPREPGQSPPGS